MSFRQKHEGNILLASILNSDFQWSYELVSTFNNAGGYNRHHERCWPNQFLPMSHLSTPQWEITDILKKSWFESVTKLGILASTTQKAASSVPFINAVVWSSHWDSPVWNFPCIFDRTGDNEIRWCHIGASIRIRKTGNHCPTAASPYGAHPQSQTAPAPQHFPIPSSQASPTWSAIN